MGRPDRIPTNLMPHFRAFPSFPWTKKPVEPRIARLPRIARSDRLGCFALRLDVVRYEIIPEEIIDLLLLCVVARSRAQ